MDQLLEINSFRKLYVTVDGKDEDEFKEWFIQLGLLHRRRLCPHCHREMSWRGPFVKTLNGAFVCKYRDGCRDTQFGTYVDTFFHNVKIPLKDVFLLSFCWSFNRLTHEDITRELHRDQGQSTVSSHTIVDWMNFFRYSC